MFAEILWNSNPRKFDHILDFKTGKNANCHVNQKTKCIKCLGQFINGIIQILICTPWEIVKVEGKFERPTNHHR